MASPTELDLHGRIRARLALVREDLDEVLARLNEDDLGWAPTSGMRTIAGQLTEIACTEKQVLLWMRDGKHVPYSELLGQDENGASLTAMKDVLAHTRQSTLAYLDSLSPEELEIPVPFPERWFESLRQPTMARSEAFRSIAQHEWYHVGQLVSYLWSRSDDPYKW